MQLVLSNNRIIAHGENFLSTGGTVINTVTGAKHENATIAECDGCPSDIDTVGYEYHAGVFVPCAPYGKGNNNGCFMEVCTDCATPRNSGIPIKGGINLENLHSEVTANALGGTKITLLWENASPKSSFDEQTITLTSADYDFLFLVCVTPTDDALFTSLLQKKSAIPVGSGFSEGPSIIFGMTNDFTIYNRSVEQNEAKLTFSAATSARLNDGQITRGIVTRAIPYQIYGVKI